MAWPNEVDLAAALFASARSILCVSNFQHETSLEFLASDTDDVELMYVRRRWHKVRRRNRTNENHEAPLEEQQQRREVQLVRRSVAVKHKRQYIVSRTSSISWPRRSMIAIRSTIRRLLLDRVQNRLDTSAAFVDSSERTHVHDAD